MSRVNLEYYFLENQIEFEFGHQDSIGSKSSFGIKYFKSRRAWAWLPRHGHGLIIPLFKVILLYTELSLIRPILGSASLFHHCLSPPANYLLSSALPIPDHQIRPNELNGQSMGDQSTYCRISLFVDMYDYMHLTILNDLMNLWEQ